MNSILTDYRLGLRLSEFTLYIEYNLNECKRKTYHANTRTTTTINRAPTETPTIPPTGNDSRFSVKYPFKFKKH